MRKELWLDAELNLQEALNDEDYDSLLKYAEENQQHLVLTWAGKDTDFFRKVRWLGMSILHYFEGQLSKRDLAVFRLGALMGEAECYDRLTLVKPEEAMPDGVDDYEACVLSLPPQMLINYMVGTGWVVIPRKKSGIKALHLTREDGALFQVTVPLGRTLADYDDAMITAVPAIAAAERCTNEEMLRKILQKVGGKKR